MEYTVGEINSKFISEIKIYSPVDTWFYVRSTFKFSDNFCTRNIIHKGQSVYCFCNIEECLDDTASWREPMGSLENTIIEIRMGEHKIYDLEAGEPLYKENVSKIMMVYNVVPRFKTPLSLTALSLPRIPENHFFFHRDNNLGKTLGFIAIKRILYASINYQLTPFCSCQNMCW